MLKFIKNIFSFSDENNKKNTTNVDSQDSRGMNIGNQKVLYRLEDNKTYIKNIFNNCADLVIRELKITNNPNFSAMLVYLDNMIQEDVIGEFVVEKLTDRMAGITYPPNSKEYSQYLLGIRDKDLCTDMKRVIDSILSGGLVLIIDGITDALIVNITSPPGRSIEEPQVETVIRGPREGFTESIATNIALIRKKIKSANLKMESLTIGVETRTAVTIAYLSHIADDKIVAEVRERLNKIDIDAVLGSNYLKEYIEDEPLSNFPTIFSTERPDVAAGKILDGRIAILVDGTPVAATVPALFVEFMLSNEDYYLKFVAATLNRWIRYLSFIISLTLPGIYVAITTFHQELIPIPLLYTIIKARGEVPYPVLLESFLMLLTYEILRESSSRMPRTVGMGLGVVGALVIGDAAVNAGLVSAPMVIIVALVAIAAFSIPSIDMSVAITIPRFILLLLGGTLGLLGVGCGLVVLLVRLMSIRSFGVPYMGPLAPVITNELSSVFMRRPHWTKFKRSWLITRRKSIKRKPESHIKSIKEEHEKAMKEKEQKE